MKKTKPVDVNKELEEEIIKLKEENAKLKEGKITPEADEEDELIK